VGVRCGLKQYCYAVGNLAMCPLIHLGRKFGGSTASKLQRPTGTIFFPRRAVYRSGCRKYPLLAQYVHKNHVQHILCNEKVTS